MLMWHISLNICLKNYNVYLIIKYVRYVFNYFPINKFVDLGICIKFKQKCDY